MKNTLFYLLFFLSRYTIAQDCILPQVYEGQSTGSNMTVLFQENFIQSTNLNTQNPYMVAQTPSGLVVGSCYLANDSLNNGMQSMALWGDDVITDDVDGAADGETISLQIVDGVDIFLVNLESFTYSTNGLSLVSKGSISYLCSGDIYGCIFSSACNYNVDATLDDGSCEYAEVFYDCSGLCVNDSDSDGTCDELEVLSCIEPMACNYNTEATEAGECTFPNPALCETCSGEFDGTGLVVVNELGADGSCIYLGCTDPSAMNFSPWFTMDDGSCDYLSVSENNSIEMFVYPNPGKEKVYVLSTKHIRLLKVQLINTKGLVIFSKSYDEVFANQPLRIGTQNIPRGIYLLTLSSSDDTKHLFWVKH